MRLNQQQAESIVRLKALPEFGVFLSVLGEYGAQMNQKLIMKDDIDINTTRGELRFLSKLQHAIESAPSIAQQFHQQQKEHADGTP